MRAPGVPGEAGRAGLSSRAGVHRHRPRSPRLLHGRIGPPAARARPPSPAPPSGPRNAPGDRRHVRLLGGRGLRVLAVRAAPRFRRPVVGLAARWRGLCRARRGHPGGRRPRPRRGLLPRRDRHTGPVHRQWRAIPPCAAPCVLRGAPHAPGRRGGLRQPRRPGRLRPLPIHVVEEDVKAGRLWRLPPYKDAPVVDVHLVHDRSARLSRAERTLLAELGATYGRYIQGRKRLMPFVW
mgnify:CR=1 FL=1